MTEKGEVAGWKLGKKPAAQEASIYCNQPRWSKRLPFYKLLPLEVPDNYSYWMLPRAVERGEQKGREIERLEEMKAKKKTVAEGG